MAAASRNGQSGEPSGSPNMSTRRFASLSALIISLLVALGIGIRSLWPYWTHPHRAAPFDPDSTMRMQQVHDWLHGQGWFDLSLSRFGLYGATPMHWTRLGDLGPAALIRCLTPFLGEAQAEHWAMLLYPVLLIIPLSFVSLWLIKRLAPKVSIWAAGLCFALMSWVLKGYWFPFSPGDIDHHNIQIIAFLIFVGAIVGERTHVSGSIASLGLVAGLVVGLDALPFIALGMIVLTLFWVLAPARESPFLRGMGMGTISFALLGAVFFVPHIEIGQFWNTRYCDSWTIPVVALFLVFGAVLLAMGYGLNRIGNPVGRLLATAVLGFLALTMIVVLFPACRDPLPLHAPILQKYWMRLIVENFPIMRQIRELPGWSGHFAAPILAMGLYLADWRQRRNDWRASAPLVVMMLAAILFAIFQSRGLGLMLALTPIFLVLALVGWWRKAHSNAQKAIMALGLAVIASPLGWASAEKAIFPQYSRVRAANVARVANNVSCMGAKELAQIRALPRGLIISAFGASEYLLRNSDHRVAFAAYHRARDDNAWVISVLLTPPEQAYAQLRKPEGGPLPQPLYLNFCRQSLQFQRMALDAPDSLIARLWAGQPPAWLLPRVALIDNGQIYEVRLE